MKSQDILILLKIIALDKDDWQQKTLAEALNISQSEISQSLLRMRYSGLLLENGREVMRLAFVDFLQYGISYVFPQHPGAIVRGIPTAHSAYPLNLKIVGDEIYVWPHAKGTMRGQAVIPLYPTVPEASQKDDKLYQLLVLIDALRVGQRREKELALKELKNTILNGK